MRVCDYLYPYRNIATAMMIKMIIVVWMTAVPTPLIILVMKRINDDADGGSSNIDDDFW